MKVAELEKIMDDLLKRAGIKLFGSYYNESPKKETRIIFPKKRDGSVRVSEQEMRFAFVEAFNETYADYSENLYYAVEVPTKDLYDFRTTPPQIGKGQSAMFDLVLYDDNGPRVFIEFKGNNPSAKHYNKDFCKLENEIEYGEKNNTLRYFIEILKNSNSGTKRSLSRKCIEHPDIIFKFFDLSSGSYLTDIKL